ncbi:MAG: peptide chain release factor N(5)-glutamine methyltransferase [Firmicutes bacterium]|jgi:release factor glutamine methyltransferase|nr:peptide chain release factor N(5)-glutamine methyltransferase [Bacillota bacterium]
MVGDRLQVLGVLKLATDYLRSRGIDSARLDAEVLLAEILGMERIRLYVEYDRPLSGRELGAYREAVARRAARVPVAYITGHKEFMSLDFAVDSRVLVPRPDTEILVEAARDEILSMGVSEPMIVDLGTGSGAIACSLGKLLPSAHILATDISSDALAVAEANVVRLGLDDRVRLAQGDLFEPLDKEGFSRVHAVVSNPPYIPEVDMSSLVPEISKHEPAIALLAGPDGLDFFRRMAAEVSPYLEPGGLIALEVGDGQANAVAGLLEDAGLVMVRRVCDYAGHFRVVLARTPKELDGEADGR